MWKSKLFWRFFAVYAILIVVSATILVSYFSARQRTLMLAQLRSRLQDTAYLLANESQQYLETQFPADYQEQLAALEARSEIRMTIIAPEGRVLADSSESPEVMDNHLDRAEVAAALAEGVGYSERRSDTVDSTLMYVAVLVGDESTPDAIVRTSMRMSAVNQDVARMQRMITTFAVCLSLVALAATYLLALRVVRPLNELTQAASRVSEGTFGPDVVISTGDELETLADTFNTMSRQLDLRLKQLDQRNQEVLNASERLRTVLGSMNEGVVAIDRDENVLFVNRAAANTFDLSQRDQTGRPLVEVIRHPRVHEVVREVLEGRHILAVEIELPRKEITLSVIASRLPGEPAGGVVMVFHDMTDLRRLENLRREFVSNVSHELKTPLASIQAYTDTLLEGGLEDPNINRKFLERIDQQAERLHMLILDVLKIAQVESGQEMFDMTAVNLLEMVRECVNDHLAIAESKQIDLDFSAMGTDENLRVHADVDGLRTILDNLLDNAIKYTPEGGKVSVRWELDGPRVFLHVQDTGVGISPEHKARIFERFYRVDKGRSRDMGGTGLGLSIVKHLASVFGGGISVESERGSGSLFTVELRQA